jgi:hypothetical protein
MLSSKPVFLFLIFIVSLNSCQNNIKPDKDKQVKDIPKALQDKDIIRSTYSEYKSGGDLIEELYQELTSKNPILKEFEEDVESYKEVKSDLDKKFHKYDEKSESYYHDAMNKINSIQDSILKLKITSVLNESRINYEEMKADLIAVIEASNKNAMVFEDFYMALKVLLTLKLIEDFQETVMTDTTEYFKLVEFQKKLIFKADSLTYKK